MIPFTSLRNKWKWSYGQYSHSGIRVRPKTMKNDKLRTRSISLKNSSPELKADFPNKNKVKSTIHKCVANVIPVTNPTQYTKSVNIKWNPKVDNYWKYRSLVFSHFLPIDNLLPPRINYMPRLQLPRDHSRYAIPYVCTAKQLAIYIYIYIYICTYIYI